MTEHEPSWLRDVALAMQDSFRRQHGTDCAVTILLTSDQIAWADSTAGENAIRALFLDWLNARGTTIASIAAEQSSVQ